MNVTGQFGELPFSIVTQPTQPALTSLRRSALERGMMSSHLINVALAL